MNKKPTIPEPPGRPGRKEIRLLVAVGLLAFLLRLVFFLQLNRSPLGEMVIEDSKTYHDWAAGIAAGDWVGDGVFTALPLYPYLLGLIYTIFGVSIPAARLVQVVLGTVNCGLIYLLGRRLFGPPAGLLAAGLTAVYGWLIVYDSAILSPVAIIFFAASLLLLLLRLRDRRAGWPGWTAAGVLAGLTATISGHSLPFIILAAGWILFSRKRLKAALCFLAGAAVVLGLVAYRNWKVGDDWVPLTAHGGINFYIGNNPHARGVFEPPPILRSGGATLQQDAETIARRTLGRELKPSEVNSFWFRQGMEFIRNHPGRFFQLLGRKFTIFFDQLEIADVIHPAFFRRWTPILAVPFPVFGMIAPLALLGLVLAGKRWRELLLLYLFVAGYILSTILYFVNSRYRLPLVPFLMIFAAYAIVWIVRRARKRKWLPLAAALAALVLLVLWVNPQLVGEPRFVLNLGAGHNHLGTFFSRQGDLDRAREEFAEALRLEPQRPEAHYNLANIDFRQGELEKAEAGYREAVRRNPYYESAHLALALVSERRGAPEKASNKYREVIHNLPFSPRPYLGLSRLLLVEGEPEEAIRVIDRGLEENPRVPEFHLYRGMARERAGDRKGAIGDFRRGVELAPRSVPLRMELGRNLSADPLRREEAQAQLEEAVRLDPSNAAARLYLGDLHYREGRRAEAGRAWRAAREIDPSSPLPVQRLRMLE